MEKINWADYKGPVNPVLEAYRSIRTNLQHVVAGKKAKLIEFTSNSLGALKSSVVAGLAIVLAQEGKRILLIDGNINEPVQHILFDLPNQGILECIEDNTNFSTRVQYCVELPNLHILTSGILSNNEKEVMVSSSMLEFFAKVKEEYDFILLDVPPVENSIDAVVIGQKVDGVVLIVTSGEDKLTEVLGIKNQFEQVGAQLLGCIVR